MKDKRQSSPKRAVSWIGVGLAIGAGIGIALDELALGLGFGLVIGALISRNENRRRDQEDNTDDQ
jgi:membrane associated rhomboid family serine protease